MEHISILTVKGSRNLRPLLSDWSISALKTLTGMTLVLVNIYRVKAHCRRMRTSPTESMHHFLLGELTTFTSGCNYSLFFLPLHHFIHLLLLPYRDLLQHRLEFLVLDLRFRTRPEILSLLLDFLLFAHEPLQGCTVALLIGFLQFKRL